MTTNNLIIKKEKELCLFLKKMLEINLLSSNLNNLPFGFIPEVVSIDDAGDGTASDADNQEEDEDPRLGHQLDHLLLMHVSFFNIATGDALVSQLKLCLRL